MEQSYLRPMNVGEILDSSVKLYHKNFLPLVIAQLPAMLFYLVNGLFSMFSTGASEPSTLVLNPYLILLYLVVALLGAFVVYPLAFSAVVKVASDNILGNPSSAKKAYKFCLREWWRYGLTYFELNLIQGIAIGIAYAIFIVPIAILGYALLSGGGTGAGLIFGFVIALVFMGFGASMASFFWTRWILTFPAAVNEGIFYYKPMERSWNLVKGRTLRVFLPLFIVSIIPYIVIFSPIFMGGLLGGLGAVQGSLSTLILVFGTLSQGLLVPLVHVTRVVTYFELRARKEGFDLEKRVERLE